jgi:hypothetical protein
MKGATRCAQRLRQVFRSLRASLGKIARPPVSDPVTQLILGVFSRDMPEAKAREALERFREMVVDYNELRVIAPLELAGMLGRDYPDVRIKCEDLSRALNRIFAIEHRVCLDRLADMSKKDVATYLARVDGLEPYTRARIRLLGLQQHAIPLDEAMWAFARANEIVDAKCDLEEAQFFLERSVSADDALDFVALVRRQAWADFGAAVRKREVERIRSVPPDRTSRNMLAQFSTPATEDDVDGIGDLEVDPAAEGDPARDQKAARLTKRRPAATRRRDTAATKAARRSTPVPVTKAAAAPTRAKRKPRARGARST